MYVDGMYLGGFFDMPDKSYPADARYYFNVLLYDIAVRPGDISLPQLQDMDEVWYLQNITEPRPTAVHIWVDHNKWRDNDPIYDMEEIPHSVIEVRPNEITWYRMTDRETVNPWTFEVDEEENDEYEPVW